MKGTFHWKAGLAAGALVFPIGCMCAPQLGLGPMWLLPCGFTAFVVYFFALGHMAGGPP